MQLFFLKFKRILPTSDSAKIFNTCKYSYAKASRSAMSQIPNLGVQLNTSLTLPNPCLLVARIEDAMSQLITLPIIQDPACWSCLDQINNSFVL